jgi:hypothetical protein
MEHVRHGHSLRRRGVCRRGSRPLASGACGRNVEREQFASVRSGDVQAQDHAAVNKTANNGTFAEDAAVSDRFVVGRTSREVVHLELSTTDLDEITRSVACGRLLTKNVYGTFDGFDLTGSVRRICDEMPPKHSGRAYSAERRRA